MPKLLRPILFCALLFATTATAQTSDTAVITVTAEGSVTAAPDMAFISVGVAERRPSANQALEAMSLGTQQVLDRLTTAGIASEDMQTGQLSLQPYYESSSLDREPKVAGFEAYTTINVRVRDLPILGKVLDAAVQDGANRLGGIRFDVSDAEPLLDDARRDAVRRAQAKAELFVQAAGVELGALLSLTEEGGQFGGPMAMEMRMMDAASSVPIAEGEMTLTATVTMIYEIAQ
ncbi:SIMPL domain-containing protein [Flavimaricola marinus]|nr:SIMPL domain-containing protein [Flavimaricola marinus]